MAEVVVKVGGRTYALATPDGGEGRIRELAGIVDARARRLDTALGPLAENQLLLTTALTLADALAEAETVLARAAAQAEAFAAALEADLQTP